MFEYDSKNDQYNEIWPGETLEKPTKRNSFSACSYRSSRSINNTTIASRIISKSGRLNIYHVKIPKKYVTYLRDLGNTLLNTRWRWIMISLCVVNFFSFFLFGLFWMWIAYISGDFDEKSQDLCIINTKSLTGYILLSIETMLTIGYGYRYPTEKCVMGWVVPLLQALVSIGIQGILVSAVYVKISKPFTKNSLSIFSRKAIIHQRDGNLCLVVRLADLTGKISIGTTVNMYFINKDFSDSDSVEIKQIRVEPFGSLIFPVEIVHVIDSESPFWEITPWELLVKPIEIVVVAEGLSVVTGQPSQNRTSYVNSDIMWGHRFSRCVYFDEIKESFVVSYNHINKVFAFDTPLCSAQELNEISL